MKETTLISWPRHFALGQRNLSAVKVDTQPDKRPYKASFPLWHDFLSWVANGVIGTPRLAACPRRPHLAWLQQPTHPPVQSLAERPASKASISALQGPKLRRKFLPTTRSLRLTRGRIPYIQIHHGRHRGLLQHTQSKNCGKQAALAEGTGAARARAANNSACSSCDVLRLLSAPPHQEKTWSAP